MPIELRKRKAPAVPPPAPPAKRKITSTKTAKANGAAGKKAGAAATANGTSSSAKVAVGQTLSLEGFGGEVETQDGQKTTLKKLVDASKAGVIIFTYPKASTPGCTTQACLFRDSYHPLTATGLVIYGLSNDSPKANTTFKTKHNLPYTLLCDPNATLIGAIGLKKPPKSTTRGVFVIDKQGKVLAAEAGGPAATVDAVQKLVGSKPATGKAGTAAHEDKAKETHAGKLEDTAKAEVAADVADTAAKLDGEPAKH